MLLIDLIHVMLNQNFVRQHVNNQHVDHINQNFYYMMLQQENQYLMLQINEQNMHHFQYHLQNLNKHYQQMELIDVV